MLLRTNESPLLALAALFTTPPPLFTHVRGEKPLSDR